jgi:hypothetical protein
MLTPPQLSVDVKTPLPRRIATSPENGYFHSMRTLVAPRSRASRYKEDWEELEFLVCDIPDPPESVAE